MNVDVVQRGVLARERAALTRRRTLQVLNTSASIAQLLQTEHQADPHAGATPRLVPVAVNHPVVPTVVVAGPNGGYERLTLDEAAARIQQLTAALDTRGEIGRAQGRLMERYEIGADTAFEVLTRISSQTNRKLRDIAAELASTGEMDGLPPTA